MDDSRTLKLAGEIIAQWPEFRQEFLNEDDYVTRLVLPNRAGLLRVLRDDDGNRVMYTARRGDTPVIGLPTVSDWRMEDGLLWLCDLCYDKDMAATAATLLVGQDMVDLGWAEENERIVFYRSNSERYGYARVKVRGNSDGEGQTSRNSYQPVQGDAQLAQG